MVKELLTGIEPVNLILTKDVLYQLSYSSKQARRELNPQPLVLETSALPIELRT